VKNSPRWYLAQCIAAVLAVCAAAGLAGAQDIVQPAPAGDSDVIDAEEFEAILQSLTPEQVELMIEVANERRIAVERRGTIAELRQGLYYDPLEIDEAVVFLEANPAATRAESITRVCEAFAIVDNRFADVQRLLAEDDAENAVAAARKVLDPTQATYLSAATHLLYADALRAAGEGETAVEAYREVLAKMPERLSFAAEANLRAAETSHDIGRFLYALQLYQYCAHNYGLTLTAEEYQHVTDQIAELREIYDAPLSAVSDMMGDVHERLAVEDSGSETQATEQHIVAVLEDLIKTAEEQRGGGQSGKSGSSDRQKKDGENGQRGQRGQGEGQASRPGNRPTSPMRESRIVPGRLPKPVRGTSVHDTDESGDWADLPPREREQLQEIARRNMSERHRRMTTRYHRRLTEEGSD